jgi:NADPH:quinone reductase-like Zn-dependent oxidoreductase
MKAVRFENYGSPNVLKTVEIEKPIAKDHEVLIKISATSVTPADWRIRKPEPFLARIENGLFKPKKVTILGTELSGIVVGKGKDVKDFEIGDEIYAETYFTGYGAYAEYICVPERGMIAIKPSNIGFNEAAVIPMGANTALFFIRDKGNLKKGDKILIIGASGSLGSYAVQLSKYFKAEITGVCAGENIDLVKSLGASKVIDYRTEDILNTEDKFDIIFDTACKNSVTGLKKLLKPNGVYLSAFPTMQSMLQMIKTSFIGNKKVIYATATESKENLIFIRNIVEKGKLKPILDKCYSIGNISEAHAYVESGRKKGNVAIMIDWN